MAPAGATAQPLVLPLALVQAPVVMGPEQAMHSSVPRPDPAPSAERARRVIQSDPTPAATVALQAAARRTIMAGKGPVVTPAQQADPDARMPKRLRVAATSSPPLTADSAFAGDPPVERPAATPPPTSSARAHPPALRPSVPIGGGGSASSSSSPDAGIVGTGLVGLVTALLSLLVPPLLRSPIALAGERPPRGICVRPAGRPG